MGSFTAGLAQLALLGPFASVPFRLAVISRILVVTGDFSQIVVLVAVALSLTQSTAVWGTVLMLSGIPTLLLMPFGGLLTDRFRPQVVMLVSAALMSGVVATGSLTNLRRTGLIGAFMVMLTGLMLALASVLPSVVAMLPLLVISGLANAALVIIFVTIVQTRAEPAMRGRVMSFGSDRRTKSVVPDRYSCAPGTSVKQTMVHKSGCWWANRPGRSGSGLLY